MNPVERTQGLTQPQVAEELNIDRRIASISRDVFQEDDLEAGSSSISAAVPLNLQNLIQNHLLRRARPSLVDEVKIPQEILNQVRFNSFDETQKRREKILSFLIKSGLSSVAEQFRLEFELEYCSIEEIDLKQGLDLILLECLCASHSSLYNINANLIQACFKLDAAVAESWFKIPLFIEQMTPYILDALKSRGFIHPQIVGCFFDSLQNMDTDLIRFVKDYLISSSKPAIKIEEECLKIYDAIQSKSTIDQFELLRFSVLKGFSPLAKKILENKAFSAESLNAILAECTDLPSRLILSEKIKQVELSTRRLDFLSAAPDEEFCDICTHFSDSAYFRQKALQYAFEEGHLASLKWLLENYNFSLEELNSLKKSKLDSANRIVEEALKNQTEKVLCGAYSLTQTVMEQDVIEIFESLLPYLEKMDPDQQIFDLLKTALLNNFEPFIHWQESKGLLKDSLIILAEQAIDQEDSDLFDAVWPRLDNVNDMDRELNEIMMLAVDKNFSEAMEWGFSRLQISSDDQKKEIFYKLIENKNIESLLCFLEHHELDSEYLSESFLELLMNKEYELCSAILPRVTKLNIDPNIVSSHDFVEQLEFLASCVKFDKDTILKILHSCIEKKNRAGLDVLFTTIEYGSLIDFFRSEEATALNGKILKAIFEKQLLQLNDPIFSWRNFPDEQIIQLSRSLVAQNNYIFLAKLFHHIGPRYESLLAQIGGPVNAQFIESIQSMHMQNIWAFTTTQIARDPFFLIQGLTSLQVKPGHYIYANQEGRGDGVKKQFLVDLLKSAFIKLEQTNPQGLACFGEFLSLLFENKIPLGDFGSKSFLEDLLFLNKTPELDHYIQHKINQKQNEGFASRVCLYEFLATQNPDLTEQVRNVLLTNQEIGPLVLSGASIDKEIVLKFLSKSSYMEKIALDYPNLQTQHQELLEPIISGGMENICVDTFDELHRLFADPIKNKAEKNFPIIKSITYGCSFDYLCAIENKEFEKILGIGLAPGFNIPFNYVNEHGVEVSKTDPSLTESDQSVLEKIDWIQEKVEKSIADKQYDWVKKLLFFMTSAPSLLPGTVVGVRKNNLSLFPRTQTCFKILHLTDQRQTKEEFLEKLTEAIQTTTFEFE